MLGCSVLADIPPCLSMLCVQYLLVEIRWSSESPSTVANVGLAAADWDAVVLGFFKPVSVPPVRVIVNAAAVKLTGEQRSMVNQRSSIFNKAFV